MPGPDGLLSPKEQEDISRWLTEKGAIRPCPSCGREHWAIADRLGYVPMYGSSGVIIGGGYPAVLTVCTNCTFFKWHSAVAMGLADGAEEKKTEGAKHGA